MPPSIVQESAFTYHIVCQPPRFAALHYVQMSVSLDFMASVITLQKLTQ